MSHSPDRDEYEWAHNEHAWLLRAEGLTLQAIGDRMGVTRERVRQRICKFSRRMQRAVRHRMTWDERIEEFIRDRGFDPRMRYF